MLWAQVGFSGKPSFSYYLEIVPCWLVLPDVKMSNKCLSWDFVLVFVGFHRDYLCYIGLELHNLQKLLKNKWPSPNWHQWTLLVCENRSKNPILFSLFIGFYNKNYLLISVRTHSWKYKFCLYYGPKYFISKQLLQWIINVSTVRL